MQVRNDSKTRGARMKIAVTGGAGFIGSNLCQKLSEEHEVVVVDNLSSGKRENLTGLGVTLFEGSITDLELLKKAFSGVDCVFHEAAIVSVQRSVDDPLPTNDVNIGGTLKVLTAARDCGAKKLVFASSSAIYGFNPSSPKREEMIPEPASPYAVSKIAGEYYCRIFSELYGLKTVSLRYFNVYGPRQDPSSEYSAVIPKFASRLLQNKPPVIYGDGLQTRDFVFVKDVVQANLSAMKKDAQGVFNVACGRGTSINEIAKSTVSITGASVSPIYEPPREGDIKDSLADISRAKKELGLKPEYDLDRGLRETVRWLKTEMR